LVRWRRNLVDHAALSSHRVTASIQGGVADVRLNRPDKINALDVPMLRALVDTGEQLKDDPSVRVVVLSGEGRGFCAGLDFGNLQAMAGGDGETAGSGDGVLRQIGDPPVV
jgi:enoyl-CoA hydratase/carnithine racemase